ncbi:MAG TPA: hypothetical protein VJ843_02830 [Candidatus Saccharimonadales bacterium]|nr:hypothetical protein [Candidatus Saccharimonadales bacterium]
MLPEAAGFIVPPDEILTILQKADMSIDTQPTPVGDELLDRFVAVATVHQEEGGDLLSVAPAHIGHVAAIGNQTGHVHLDWRIAPKKTNVTLIVPERFHTPISFNPDMPNFTQNLAVQSLFYLLPRGRRQ